MARFSPMVKFSILHMIGIWHLGIVLTSRGRPFEFKLGAGQVIKGWDQGLLEYSPLN